MTPAAVAVAVLAVAVASAAWQLRALRRYGLVVRLADEDRALLLEDRGPPAGGSVDQP